MPRRCPDASPSSTARVTLGPLALCHRSAVPNLGSILGRAAAWPSSYLHRLPDDAFLHVETGGRIDPSGRTLPRSHRHLPVRDADGALDLPHLRDAMAQLPNAGPWLASDVRDTLIAKAKTLHAAALTTTHKAAKGLPDWSLGYLAHLDRHEALGVPREEAHKAWAGDKMIGGRAVDLLKGLKRGGAPVSKAVSEVDSVVAALRKKVATFNARVGDRPGMKQSLKALAKAYDRGTAAFDATRRPMVKSREQWGAGRVNAMLRLTASGKPDHPSYTGDNDLLPAGHPRTTTKATAAKPSSVTRPKSPAPVAPVAPPPAQPPKPKAGIKPPKGKAPLPVKAKPAEAEKAVDTSVLGEDVDRTGGSPWPDADMAWLSPENVYDQLDTASSYARRDAELPTDASGDVAAVDWIPLTSPVAKDELGGADLANSGKLAPDQGFEQTAYQGIPIVVDRPKGTVQTGIGKDGEAWSRTYQTDYGYVPATAGGDGEELDVFLGPNPETPTAWVAVQTNDAGDFDELKVFLGYNTEADARACYLAHIPERFLASLQAVPVALLQGMLGLEPVAMAKSVGSPRVSFSISGGKVHVQWPTKVYSDPTCDPASAPAVVAAAAPEMPAGGAVPDSPASFTMSLAPDELEAAAKSARAVQSMLLAGPARAIGKLPGEGETEKGMDGGCLLYSPTDALLDDPGELAALLSSLKTPWLAEHPDTPRARLELAKAGKVLAHKDVPGSIFVASYPMPEGVDVFEPHPDAGDDEATAFKATTAGPDGDEPLNNRPPGSAPEPNPDADRGVAGGMTNGVVKAEPTEHTIVLKTGADGMRAIAGVLGAMKRTGDVGHGAVLAYEDGGYFYQCAYFDGDGSDKLADVTLDGKPLKVDPADYTWNNKALRPVGKTVGTDEAEKIAARSSGVAKADLTFIAVGKAEAAVEQRFALGPVLIPNTVDLQGDSVSAEEIEKSERRFMSLYQNAGIQHEAEPSDIKGFRDSNPELANGKIVIVESYIVRDDRGFAMIGGRKVLTGTWVMGTLYPDDTIWNEVKSGKRTGYSIGGFARRVPVEGAEAARG